MKNLLLFLTLIVNFHLKADKQALIDRKIDTVYKLIENDITEVELRSKEIINLSKKINYLNGVGKGLFCLGLFHEHSNQIDSALVYVHLANEIFEKQENKRNLASSYNNMASLYKNLENYPLAIKYNKLSFDIYKEYKDSISMADLWNNAGNIYVNLDSVGKNMAITYYQKAYNFYKALNVLEEQFSIHVNLGVQYEEAENYKMAEKYFQKALKLAKQNNSISQEINARVNISYLFAKTKQFEKAKNQLILSYNKAEEFNVLNEQMLVVNAYIHLFENQEDFKSALIWTKIKQKLDDDITREKHNLFAIKTEAQLKTEKKERKIKELILQQKVDDKQKTILYITIILILLIISFLYYFKRKEYITKKEIAKQKRLLLQEQLQRAELENNLINSDLKNRKELLSNIAVHMVQKNEMINNIIKEIKIISKSKGNLSKELNSLSLDLKQKLLVGKDIEEFNFQLNKINNRFYKDLEILIPNLTKNEKKLAALLRLGFTSKEIAITNFSSESAVKIARHRLRKKINLPSNQNLSDFFKNLKM